MFFSATSTGFSLPWNLPILLVDNMLWIWALKSNKYGIQTKTTLQVSLINYYLDINLSWI